MPYLVCRPYIGVHLFSTRTDFQQHYFQLPKEFNSTTRIIQMANNNFNFHISGIDRALLQSPVYGNVDAKCEINFWFNKKGGSLNTMRLNILISDSQGGWVRSRLWAMTANSQASQDWTQAGVDIGARQAGFKLEFEAIKLLADGTMAIDDVTFKNCASGMLKFINIYFGFARLEKHHECL